MPRIPSLYLKNEVKLEVKRIPILVKQSQSKPIYINALTGEESKKIEKIIPENAEYKLIPIGRKKPAGVGNTAKGVSIQYDKENDLLVFIVCFLDMAMARYNRPVEWIELGRFYISRDKKVYRRDKTYFYNIKRYNLYTDNPYLCDEMFKDRISEEDFNQYDLGAYVETNFPKDRLFDFKNILSINDNNTREITMENGKQKLIDFFGDSMKVVWDFFAPIVSLQGNRMIALDSVISVKNFIQYKEPTIKAGTKQKKLDRLLSYNLKDVVVPKKLINVDTQNYRLRQTYDAYDINVERYATIERVPYEEPCCVLRTFYKIPDTDIIREGARMYMLKKEIVSSKRLNDGNYMYQTILNTPDNWRFSIETFDSSVTEGTIAEYFGKCLEKISYKNRGLALWSFVKYPLTEQIYKAGMEQLMDNIFSLTIEQPLLNTLMAVFGRINEKEKTLHSKLGINKFQFDMIKQDVHNYMPTDEKEYYSYQARNILPYVKYILNENNTNFYVPYYFSDYVNISSIDNNTFTWVYNIVKKVIDAAYDDEINKKCLFFYWSNDRERLIYQEIHTTISCFKALVSVYGIPTAQRMADKILSLLYVDAIMDNNSYFNRRALYQYLDYISMVKNMNNNTRDFRADFETLEDLKNMHDAASVVFNTYKTRFEKEKWDKRKPYWDKFEYKTEEYSIVIPKLPEDLAKEGIALHHCVKTYVNKVSDGITNIVFLRKNDDLETPFYTIEVDNNNYVQQVHGLCNCTVSKNPEIIPFIDEWMKAKKLKADSYNKVR